MSSILSSQIISETEKSDSKATSILRELAAVLTMFAVTATVVVSLSLTWIA
ncbi:hypothetical protein [Vibrio sp. MA40-2]|uniref:hypothetical protein n=1 Tax=Vibrio sp. MA40-2 TaxID=3391828 RepID=UPI0039A66081